jgi:hypothetical protein
MRAALVPLTFAVNMPGSVVATNGELDPTTGEIFWGLYCGAAMIEDVVLTATCEQATTSGRTTSAVSGRGSRGSAPKGAAS